jgi:hypothetical protein
MRAVVGLVICFALLWMADMFLFKGHYSSQLWRDLQHEAHKIDGDVRRWTRL